MLGSVLTWLTWQCKHYLAKNEVALLTATTPSTMCNLTVKVITVTVNPTVTTRTVSSGGLALTVKENCLGVYCYSSRS
jgi:hypothetical protein